MQRRCSVNAECGTIDQNFHAQMVHTRAGFTRSYQGPLIATMGALRRREPVEP